MGGHILINLFIAYVLGFESKIQLVAIKYPPIKKKILTPSELIGCLNTIGAVFLDQTAI